MFFDIAFPAFVVHILSNLNNAGIRSFDITLDKLNVRRRLLSVFLMLV